MLLLNILFQFFCMYACMCEGIHTCVCPSKCGGQRSTLGVILQEPLLPPKSKSLPFVLELQMENWA